MKRITELTPAQAPRRVPTTSTRPLGEAIHQLLGLSREDFEVPSTQPGRRCPATRGCIAHASKSYSAPGTDHGVLFPSVRAARRSRKVPGASKNVPLVNALPGTDGPRTMSWATLDLRCEGQAVTRWTRETGRLRACVPLEALHHRRAQHSPRCHRGCRRRARRRERPRLGRRPPAPRRRAHDQGGEGLAPALVAPGTTGARPLERPRDRPRARNLTPTSYDHPPCARGARVGSKDATPVKNGRQRPSCAGSNLGPHHQELPPAQAGRGRLPRHSASQTRTIERGSRRSPPASPRRARKTGGSRSARSGRPPAQAQTDVGRAALDAVLGSTGGRREEGPASRPGLCCKCGNLPRFLVGFPPFSETGREVEFPDLPRRARRCPCRWPPPARR